MVDQPQPTTTQPAQEEKTLDSYMTRSIERRAKEDERILNNEIIIEVGTQGLDSLNVDPVYLKLPNSQKLDYAKKSDPILLHMSEDASKMTAEEFRVKWHPENNQFNESQSNRYFVKYDALAEKELNQIKKDAGDLDAEKEAALKVNDELNKAHSKLEKLRSNLNFMIRTLPVPTNLEEKYPMVNWDNLSDEQKAELSEELIVERLTDAGVPVPTYGEGRQDLKHGTQAQTIADTLLWMIDNPEVSRDKKKWAEVSQRNTWAIEEFIRNIDMNKFRADAGDTWEYFNPETGVMEQIDLSEGKKPEGQIKMIMFNIIKAAHDKIKDLASNSQTLEYTGQSKSKDPNNPLGLNIP